MQDLTESKTIVDEEKSMTGREGRQLMVKSDLICWIAVARKWANEGQKTVLGFC